MLCRHERRFFKTHERKKKAENTYSNHSLRDFSWSGDIWVCNCITLLERPCPGMNGVQLTNSEERASTKQFVPCPHFSCPDPCSLCLLEPYAFASVKRVGIFAKGFVFIIISLFLFYNSKHSEPDTRKKDYFNTKWRMQRLLFKPKFCCFPSSALRITSGFIIHISAICRVGKGAFVLLEVVLVHHKSGSVCYKKVLCIWSKIVKIFRNENKYWKVWS